MFKRRPSGPCVKCGTWRYSLHRDHVVPKHLGGVDTPDNWQYICANCHEDKTRDENQSETSRERVRAFHTGRKRAPETGQRISAALTGRILKPLTAEHREKISRASRGRPKPFSASHLANLRVAIQARAERQRLVKREAA